MTPSHPSAPSSARAEAPSRAAQLEKRLRRFETSYRPRVRALSDTHFALADLALGFPALLFALATTRDRALAARGIVAAVAGRSLKEVAVIAGVPMWTRALPAEAFTKPLPALPDGPLFARRVANHLPRTPKQAETWLRAVADAFRWGDENLAVWIARELSRRPEAKTRGRRRKRDGMELERLELVCLWAWFSTRPETEAAALAERRWSPDMKFSAALIEARRWLDGVEAKCALGDRPLADGWLTPASIDGVEFTPVLTAEDLIAEASAMHNCLRTHARGMLENRARVWSVRRDGRRLATLEITGVWGCERFLTLGEGHAPWNRSVAPDVQRAIHEWLRGQPLRAAPKPLGGKEALPDPAVWRRLMRPYWLAKRAIPPWLPLSPSDGTLSALAWG